MNLSKHEILKESYDVVQAIEECGASEKLTTAVVKASDLGESIDKLLDEIDKLKQSQFIPGQLECKKCGFAMYKKFLNMKSGTVTVNREPNKCLNGCGPMWKMSWEQGYHKLMDSCDKLVDERNLFKKMFKETWDLIYGIKADRELIAHKYFQDEEIIHKTKAWLKKFKDLMVVKQ